MDVKAIKDVSPDNVYFMTWLIECIEFDDDGESIGYEFDEHITQDYYMPTADYVLNQEANNKKLIEQINRTWTMGFNCIVSSYLKELAIKFVHKKYVRYGANQIHEYFEEWIDYTTQLLIRDGDILNRLVYNYDIDELVRQVRYNKKLYSMVLYKPDNDISAQCLRIRLKDFFDNELEKPIILTKAVSVLQSQQVDLKQRTTISQRFLKAVLQYDFYELEKVKCLDGDQQNKLIAFFVENKTAYGVAMLNFLGFYTRLKKVYNLKVGAQDKLIAEAFGINKDNAGKYRRSVTIPDSPASYGTFTAVKHEPQVKYDYALIFNKKF